MSCLIPYTTLRISEAQLIFLCCLTFSYPGLYPNISCRISKAEYVYTIVDAMYNIGDFYIYNSYLLSKTVITLFLNNQKNDLSNPYYCYQVQDTYIAFLVEEKEKRVGLERKSLCLIGNAGRNPGF